MNAGTGFESQNATTSTSAKHFSKTTGDERQCGGVQPANAAKGYGGLHGVNEPNIDPQEPGYANRPNTSGSGQSMGDKASDKLSEMKNTASDKMSNMHDTASNMAPAHTTPHPSANTNSSSNDQKSILNAAGQDMAAAHGVGTGGGDLQQMKEGLKAGAASVTDTLKGVMGGSGSGSTNSR